MRRYLRDPTFSRFDTVPECDGHTHTHTHTDTRRRHIPRLARRRAVKRGPRNCDGHGDFCQFNSRKTSSDCIEERRKEGHTDRQTDGRTDLDSVCSSCPEQESGRVADKTTSDTTVVADDRKSSSHPVTATHSLLEHVDFGIKETFFKTFKYDSY